MVEDVNGKDDVPTLVLLLLTGSDSGPGGPSMYMQVIVAAVLSIPPSVGCRRQVTN